MSTSKETRYRFQSLIWAAAAGNVVWSLVTVAIAEDWSADGVGARFTVLLLLGVYLTTNWLRMVRQDLMNYWGCVADFLHIASVVVFAIAAQLDRMWMEWPLGIVFAVTIVGHLSGVWEQPNIPLWPKSLCLAGVSALGLLVLVGSHWFIGEPFPCNLPFAVGAALVAWVVVRARLGAW